MSHNTTINPGIGGDTIADYDLATGGAYPTTGKVGLGAIMVSATATTAPTAVTPANPLPVAVAGVAQDGTDISAPAAMPAGGSGIRGWLSAIWTKLNGSLAVTGTFWQATQPVSAVALPLPAGAALDATLTGGSQVALDTQAGGWADDLSDGGLLRASIVRDGLVKMPFRLSHIVTSSPIIFNKDITGDNADYTNTTLSLTIVGGAGVAAATVRFPFYGNAFGVRWDRNADTLQNDFGVMVDGESFYVPAARVSWDTQLAYSVTDGENRYVVARDLGDGQHWADLVFPADQTGATRKWVIYGYLAERRASYETPPRARTPLTPVVLTTTAAGVSYGANVGRYPRGLRRLHFYNSTAGPVTVTLSWSGTDFWSVSVPATSTVDYDPGDVLTVDQTADLKARASAAASITMTVVGGF